MIFFKRKKSKSETPPEPVSGTQSEPQAETAAEVQADVEADREADNLTEHPAGELPEPDSAPTPEPEDPGLPASDAEPDVKPVGQAENPDETETEDQVEEATPDSKAKPAQPKGLFARMRQGLSRTSSNFAQGIGNLLLGKKAIDDELLEEIETQLLMADVGVDATTEIIDDLTDRVARKQLNDSEALFQALRQSLYGLLEQVEQPLAIDTSRKPYVILVVGVNGVGKTTTIGKLAKKLQNEGKSVILAAGDTFRAAAVEQLQVWGDRNNISVVAQHSGADSASVIYDAVQSAQSRQVDVVIADTAGRLHNKSNLMDELAKVKRVMGKLDTEAPHEVLLVLDAGTGQNAVSQADQFKQSAGVTGIVLTKLDGTAKGGVIFALSKKHGIPVRYVGVGETIDDLQPFRAQPFVDALFSGAGSTE